MTKDRSMDAAAGAADDAPSFLAGGGEMGARMRAHDWAATALGPVEVWPQSLRTVLRLLLSSNHPMFVFWGPQHICFYNDAYSGSIGEEKHPAMLGAPGREMWEEIWPVIGPQIAMVLAGEGATWHENQLIPIIRHGRLDDVYWTYGFSPIDDDTAPHGVGGVLVVCTETTRHVMLERRQTFLVELGDRLRSLDDIQEIENMAASMVGDKLEADRVAFTAIDEAADMARSQQRWPRARQPSAPNTFRLAALRPDLISALRAGEPAVIDDIGTDPRTAGGRSPYADLNVAAFVSAPLMRNGILVNCLSVQSATPRRWTLWEVDLVREAAERTWEAAERARIEQRQKLLIEELNHRVRNTLTVVASIASQTRRHSKSIDDFGAAFDGRIQALAATHTMLADGKWDSSGLHNLIARQLGPFTRREGALAVDGPAVPFTPKRALALSLVLHELATNAAKFGALGSSVGRVEIDWTVTGDSTGRTLKLSWREAGGPPVEAPTRIGFGSKLIDQNIIYEFDGKVERDYRPEGLICTMIFPLAVLRAGS
jgi:two-component sensor histidine kinase